MTTWMIISGIIAVLSGFTAYYVIDVILLINKVNDIDYDPNSPTLLQLLSSYPVNRIVKYIKIKGSFANAPYINTMIDIRNMLTAGMLMYPKPAKYAEFTIDYDVYKTHIVSMLSATASVIFKQLNPPDYIDLVDKQLSRQISHHIKGIFGHVKHVKVKVLSGGLVDNTFEDTHRYLIIVRTPLYEQYKLSQSTRERMIIDEDQYVSSTKCDTANRGVYVRGDSNEMHKLMEILCPDDGMEFPIDPNMPKIIFPKDEPDGQSIAPYTADYTRPDAPVDNADSSQPVDLTKLPNASTPVWRGSVVCDGYCREIIVPKEEPK